MNKTHLFIAIVLSMAATVIGGYNLQHLITFIT